MSHKKIKAKEMVVKSKTQAISCSTPEHRLESPSRDSDSVCDSDAASPVPFLCTQDGADGETDVVWNFYTPKSGATKSKHKNSTPVTRRVKRIEKCIDKPVLRRRATKPSQKKIELFQELIELNELVKKPKTVTEKPQSEEDIFSDTSDSSPRSGVKSKNRCLRKNVLSSKFLKSEAESGLDSDDSLNECLIQASQAVEENILNYGPTAAKRPCIESFNIKSTKPHQNVNIGQDSMDAILSNIKLESPNVTKVKKCDTPKLNNDSFDNLLSNLNDSAFEKLSQMPVQNETKKFQSNNRESNWTLKDFVGEASPSSKTIFGRHSSMPESPSVAENQPSTSGMVFGRYNTMPLNKSNEKIIVPGDSPIRCTPEEIKKKKEMARERLLAKRVLPFTVPQSSPTQSQQPTQQNNPIQQVKSKFVPKKPVFQPKVPTNVQREQQIPITIQREQKNIIDSSKPDNNDIKLLIEKKRQEALMKLRKRQNKC